MAKPVLRGVFHEWAFFASLGGAGLLVVLAGDPLEVVASSVYVAALAVMFGASALYHRISWSPDVRAWLRRVDHSTIFVFIAGTYTPFALLVVGGWLSWTVFGAVWAGALLGVVLSVAWVDSPRWLHATVYLALGWLGVFVAPDLFSHAGITTSTLVLVGGVLYTAGAVAYAAKRPDPWPRLFGYHEIFHVLVIAAAAAQFVAVALVVA
jgi:hemolysin III